MFKKKAFKAAANARKRAVDDDDDNDGDDSGRIHNNASVVKRKQLTTTTATSSSSSSSAFVSTSSSSRKLPKDDIAGIKQVMYAASGSAASLAVNDATRTLDVDGGSRNNNNFNNPSSSSATATAAVVVAAGDDAERLEQQGQLYMGMANYAKYINKGTDHVTQSNAARIGAGPLKGTSNVRLNCRFDYQPDVCKDYKETGYCGYGDSCKFMHDRGDYKTGWQLEKEYDDKQRELAREREAKAFIGMDGGAVEEEEVEGGGGGSDDDDDLPFACLICRQDFKHPVITKCMHYFCESCALKHFAKSPKCFACGMATHGVFSVAKEIIAKVEQRKRAIEERTKEIRERVGGDDGREFDDE